MSAGLFNAGFFNTIIFAALMAFYGTANAQVMHRVPVNKTPSTAALNRQSHTCPDTTRANLVYLSDGGMLQYPNGWFISAEVKDPQPGSGWVSASCLYGVRVSAGLIPMYTVDYKMQGFNARQCNASGKTITCMR